jgi:molecular chaperone GrpE
VTNDKKDGTRAGTPPVDDDPVTSAGPAALPDVPPETRIAELEAALSTAQAEAGEYKNQWLRALAEAENVRRRLQRERDDAVKYAISGFAKDLLPVADNLRRALAAIPQEALDNDEALRNLATGVEMTERLLLAAFERYNLKRIEPLGEKFDSNLHQAMYEVPDSGQPAGTIVQVLEAGYLLHDRLVRPALVAVAKGEPAAKTGGAADLGFFK